MDFIRQWGFTQGYAPVTKTSNVRNLYLWCDRSGEYSDKINAPNGAKRRKTSTRRQKCPFLIYIHRLKTGEWANKVSNSTHNHNADFTMLAHPTARRFAPHEREIIRSASLTNTTPMNIMAILREIAPNTPHIFRDIYNERAQIRRDIIGFKTPLEHLQTVLESGPFHHAFRSDNERFTQYLLFAHNAGIAYANRYNRVFVLDCTYKTNRFGMPLFHIVGMTPQNKIFTIALCFMLNECAVSYT